MNAKDRLITGRVALQKTNPFFSYLAMNLNIVEKEEIKTCAVDCKGNLYFNSEFINSLSIDEVKTLLAHEILHIVLLHLTRLNKRDCKLWNVATDLVINNTLQNENFNFTGVLQNGLIPRRNTFDFNDIEINKIDEKIAEEIYNELNTEENKQKLKDKNGFDEHIYNEEEEENLNPLEVEQLEKKWKEKLTEGVIYAQQRGNLPKGLERYARKLLETKIDWKAILYKYITKEIPIDYTYNRPSKKSQAIGVYMPSVVKEQINISVAVDTSGSISQDELTEFLSEIVSIGKSFESIKINVMFWDTDINNHYIVNNGDIDKILNYKINGGGGTTFENVYNYVDEQIPNTKLLIFFTDGYANFPSQEEYKTLWVLTSNGIENNKIPFGEIMRLEND